MNPIRFDATVCSRLDRALEMEWLETNGLGGFASSTITGCNTRRYHGLLIAALTPPTGRQVLLSKMEETLLVNGRSFDLSVNQYSGAVHPQGHRYLVEFRLDPFPTWIYQVEGVEVEKRVFLVHGENTAVIQYELRTLDHALAPHCWLQIRPLLAFRDYHSTTHANHFFNGHYDERLAQLAITPYPGSPTLYFAHDALAIEPAGNWYYNFEYGVERERGLDFREDLYNPFLATFQVNGRTVVSFVVSTQPHDPIEAEQLRQREIRRRKEIRASSPSEDPFVQDLTLAADQYIVRRGDLKTIIAGYPWFADWGRDTMIALPGLTLSTGRPDIARDTLRAFAHYVDQGMLPNRFPDLGETPEYNTVDATLWFFEAARAYLEVTGDRDFVTRELVPAFVGIVDWHVRGTRYNIHMDADGLISCGGPGANLTWMDAKVGDWVVTPRHGKPVEIQALWYNALCFLEDLTGSAVYGRMAAISHQSFNEKFWNAADGCLYDVIDGNANDSSIRPNQVFAISLEHSILDAGRASSVLEIVRRELLTPYGLRTLSPRDPRYRSVYTGDPLSRDSAYHQGTAWPWLLGPFIRAWEKTFGPAPDFLKDLRNHFYNNGGLGQISEIFDGDAPHRPRGCFAQAWSVAEMLRIGAGEAFAPTGATTAVIR